jgi:hypothetical protein
MVEAFLHLELSPLVQQSVSHIVKKKRFPRNIGVSTLISTSSFLDPWIQAVGKTSFTGHGKRSYTAIWRILPTSARYCHLLSAVTILKGPPYYSFLAGASGCCRAWKNHELFEDWTHYYTSLATKWVFGLSNAVWNTVTVGEDACNFTDSRVYRSVLSSEDKSIHKVNIYFI